METKIRNLQLHRDVPVVVLGFFLVFTFVSAANFSEPGSNPPAGNAAAPLHVGITDQTKAGDFWADSVGSNDGFCLGADCLSAWPAGATPSNCHLETVKVQDQDPQSSYTVGSGCTVSAADAAAGWIVGSWDHCSGVSDRDCSGPKYCSFTRFKCDGAVTITPGTVTR
jgi:hypothetical protein